MLTDEESTNIEMWRSTLKGRHGADVLFSTIDRICGGLTAQEQAAFDNIQNSQTQLDMDGVMVGVSRQAIDEVVAAVKRLTGSAL